jgi:hypothetical protein
MLFFEKGETSRRRETMLSPTTRFVSESSARCAGMLRRNDTWRRRVYLFFIYFSLVCFAGMLHRNSNWRFFLIIIFFGAFPLGCFAATTPGVEGFFYFFSSARFTGMLSRNDTCRVGFRFWFGVQGLGFRVFGLGFRQRCLAATISFV